MYQLLGELRQPLILLFLVEVLLRGPKDQDQDQDRCQCQCRCRCENLIQNTVEDFRK
jgi:hypothetical protein